jgi:pimeloyl-ACP methyl ester carboxylesterase
VNPSEDACVDLLTQGRPVRWPDGPPSREAAERAFEVATGWLRRWAEEIPGMAGVDVDAAVAEARHEFVPSRYGLVHLQVHEAAAGAPTCVVSPGLGSHTRLLTPMAWKLAREGLNCVVVDRPGHGLSEGRRGDCPVDCAVDAMELGIAHARSAFGGPVVLGGESMGGILTWYALTREPDVAAAFCFSAIGHPAIHPDLATRMKSPLVRALGRLAPKAPFPVKQVANYDHVALDPRTRAYFDAEEDGVYCWKVSMRFLASLVRFEPQLDWSELEIPVLVLMGDADRMVPADFVERVLERSRPPRTTYRRLPGLGHLFIVDHVDRLVAEVAEWVPQALEAKPAPVTRRGQTSSTEKVSQAPGSPPS